MKKFVLPVLLVALTALPGFAKVKDHALYRTAHALVSPHTYLQAVYGVVTLAEDGVDGVHVVTAALDQATAMKDAKVFGAVHYVFHGVNLGVGYADSALEGLENAIDPTPDAKTQKAGCATRADGNPMCPPNRKCVPNPEGE